ncbi:indole-3-glycerol phosphate synthase-domain-containing protein [Fimicolochytrium jonesii]|uniref:indole-3-glycerol phosphate synthase-domain-containing protein n=1 Tax=Fimicolochytrium jonesii TaxID=1396493 RepID=UPI0022FE4B37|nr:indole-3-glycerol phosphate synthase-domain-containing protein [Fimicolochytrium jonesii]KAI8818738.1 indole-3-glycerol phosphate synthase-domain-containing protein [Fimicolochytrium jonesii]
MTTLLIDNYDSFTWNVYQFLSELGADVVVHRNDQITLEECIALNPRNVVISPGPGKPSDAAVSNDVIRHFAGKVPILGVCLGEQCMYEIYGGVVTYAGEIVHGKTSPVRHDGRGLYEGVLQDIECTRYHSLAGDPKTLPASLEITSTTPSGLVMGVRHKEYIMEGVQYHPESIASEYGKRMFANFLRWEGGLWKDLKVDDSAVKWDASQPPGGSGEGMQVEQKPASLKAQSILEKIHAQRLLDIQHASAQPGQSIHHLQRSLALGLAPPLVDFRARVLSAAQPVAVLAEIKRASPSKGDINITAHAPTQALAYAHAGAAVISVLTEPKWFKGSLDDMRLVRQALDTLPTSIARPAVLRKDFIVDRYQILEARLNGADTLLLIVAILTDAQLTDLLAYSRTLGMEPLVEVANEEETRRAVNVGATVIGVNNRDLHTFNMDMDRTSRLSTLVPDGIVLIALSGIVGKKDVDVYVAAGAKGVLVGEALMRTKDKGAFIAGLLGRDDTPVDQSRLEVETTRPLVKICGITNLEDAITATNAGADLLGLIFAPQSKRYVSPEDARVIVDGVFEHCGAEGSSHIRSYAHKSPRMEGKRNPPLIVGVFVNAPLDQMLRIIHTAHLDIVQFHGHEPAHLASLLPCPVFKAVHVRTEDTEADVAGRLKRDEWVGMAGVLLDTAGASSTPHHGGTGTPFDHSIATAITKHHGVPIILAGGLTVENVADAVKGVKPWCVDVASGVERSKGRKDGGLVRGFVGAVRGVE